MSEKQARPYTARGTLGPMGGLPHTRQPVELLDALDATAARLGLSRSQAVREALRAWVDARHTTAEATGESTD